MLYLVYHGDTSLRGHILEVIKGGPKNKAASGRRALWN
jgi:hypothetical protein